jgi:glycosyltransferase involved in cell wall biosynthesis
VRSVLVVEEHPARAVGGIALRAAAAVQALAQLGDVVVVGVGDPSCDAAPSGLGETRAVGLGHLPVEPADWHARPDGHPSDGRFDAASLARLAALLDELRPDVVVVEQLWLHACLPLAAQAGARTVLDAHNVEAQVYEDIAGRSGRPQDALMAERTAALERRVLAQVDQVWACSEDDRARLGPSAVLVPNVVDAASTPLRDPAGREPLLLYPASFAYPPNVVAAHVLCDEVLPAFAAQVRDARLALVGHSPPRWLRERADATVLVPGRVPSVRPWLERAAAVVVPLAEGGGTRFKVLEAMAAGVPVVSTTKGVEGLDLVDGEHLLVRDDGRAAGAAAAALWHRPEEADALVHRARAAVEERYSWRAAATAVAAALGPSPQP